MEDNRVGGKKNRKLWVKQTERKERSGCDG